MRKTIKSEELKDFLKDNTNVYNIMKIEFKDNAIIFSNKKRIITININEKMKNKKAFTFSSNIVRELKEKQTLKIEAEDRLYINNIIYNFN
ncbi:hypothetical protein [uncultured Brachyspira sp.]|uniref:hypothetical protein n=1 Tax=uncultured Brachyspira sp. TaxID=221953 RepID=UPI002621EC3F|nr:hypothetical protein [uncultured Brachyspira sp.]